MAPDYNGLMSSVPTMRSPESPGEKSSPVAVRYRVWPVKYHVRANLALAVVLLVVAAGGWWRFDDLRVSAIAVVVVLAASWRLLLPAEIEVAADRIVYRQLGRTTRVSWRTIQRAEVYRGGVLVLPVERPAPGNYLTGLYLPWGKHRQDVMACFEHYLPSERLDRID